MCSDDGARAEGGGQPAGEGGLARPGRPVDADQPGARPAAAGRRGPARQRGEAVQRRAEGPRGHRAAVGRDQPAAGQQPQVGVGLGDREDPHPPLVLVPRAATRSGARRAATACCPGSRIASSSSASRCSWWAVSARCGRRARGSATRGPAAPRPAPRRRPRPGSRGSRAAGRRCRVRGGDVRADPRQHVVAGEEQPGALLGEAQVARGVPGRVDGAHPPAREVGVLAVLQQPVGHRPCGRSPRSSLGRPTSAAASSRSAPRDTRKSTSAATDVAGVAVRRGSRRPRRRPGAWPPRRRTPRRTRSASPRWSKCRWVTRTPRTSATPPPIEASPSVSAVQPSSLSQPVSSSPSPPPSSANA